jgi:hypothetical protein
MLLDPFRTPSAYHSIRYLRFTKEFADHLTR